MKALAIGSRAALWVIAVGLGLLLLSSLLRQPLTIPQAVALSIFTGLALIRPLNALLILAALGPIISVIGILSGFAFTGSRLLETLVLLVLVPWIAVQARWIRSAEWRALDWALLGFAAVVATSAAAHLPVVALRSGGDSALPTLWELVTTTYLERPPDLMLLSRAVLLLEGLGLCAMASRLAAEPVHAGRIAGMVIAGATGAALMNVYRLLEVALRRGSVMETLAATFTSLRINTQFADLNAAGSYFAMTLVAAVGLSDVKSSRGVAQVAAAVTLALGLWLSGSRSALAGATLGILGGSMWRHWKGTSAVIRSRKRLVTFTVLAVVLVTALIVFSKARNNTLQYSLFARTELTATAFRMLGDRPVLGVGVSRFYDLFPQYASPELRQAFYESALIPVTHENAHNDFLQILAELGVVGFFGFIVLLWVALRPGRPDVDHGGIRLELIVAIGAFLFTALFGHPLLTHEAAYPFWILLGVAAAGALDYTGRPALMLRVGIGTIAVLLVAALPARVGYERRDAMLEGVALGMSNWQRDEAGNRFRWAGSRSTFFVESRAPVLKVPVRAAGSTACDVEIQINGRPVDRVTVPADIWQEVRLRLPREAAGRRSIRIDLRAGDSCASAAADPARTLMVGRPGEMGAPSDAALPR